MYATHRFNRNPISFCELTQILEDAYACCDPDFDIAFDSTIEELDRQFAERRFLSVNN